jgi:hypothetical protein
VARGQLAWSESCGIRRSSLNSERQYLKAGLPQFLARCRGTRLDSTRLDSTQAAVRSARAAGLDRRWVGVEADGADAFGLSGRGHGARAMRRMRTGKGRTLSSPRFGLGAPRPSQWLLGQSCQDSWHDLDGKRELIDGGAGDRETDAGVPTPGGGHRTRGLGPGTNWGPILFLRSTPGFNNRGGVWQSPATRSSRCPPLSVAH